MTRDQPSDLRYNSI